LQSHKKSEETKAIAYFCLMQKNIRLQFEFVAYGVLSVVALAIDALLPALDIIGITIGTTEVVDNQYSSLMIFWSWIWAFGFGP
jgi:DHA1 family bicyclomycin/chloramphenicol resistance-like MFS transporter